MSARAERSARPRRAVFLDRDGVLNEATVRAGTPHPPASLAELRIVDDAPAALAALRAAGYLLVGVTNQPDVARGTQRREVVEAINRALRSALPLEEILTCYHDDADDCACRKPRPGLLLLAAERYGIDLPRSFMVGDRSKDVEAGRRAGCRTVRIGPGYPADREPVAPDAQVDSLGEATRWILTQSDVEGRRHVRTD
jgi:D-glycero-D-manno-heptose 1,7-bisphosphate phosphatase